MPHAPHPAAYRRGFPPNSGPMPPTLLHTSEASLLTQAPCPPPCCRRGFPPNLGPLPPTLLHAGEVSLYCRHRGAGWQAVAQYQGSAHVASMGCSAAGTLAVAAGESGVGEEGGGA